jgi:hypothetical protein
MDPLGKIDEPLIKLRAKSPLAGWLLTLALAPFALFFSLVACLLVLALAPFFGLAALVVYFSLELVALRRAEYGFDRIMDGPAGNVVMALLVVVGFLLAGLTLAIGVGHVRP